MDFTINQDSKNITLKANYYQCTDNLLEIKEKIQNFSKWYTGVARLSLRQLLRKSPEEFEEYLYILITLHDNLDTTIKNIYKVYYNRMNEIDYKCNNCDNVIKFKYDETCWDCLQNHDDHLEENYMQAINNYGLDNKDETLSVKDSPTPENSRMTEVERVQNRPESPLNNFRFNFSLRYDDIVEQTLYPEKLVTSARLIDGVSDFTMQKSGKHRGVCLLCPCEMASCKMTKHSITSHVMGQKHLRNASNPTNRTALKKYHEVWMNSDLPYQAHQVYFRPEVGDSLRCVLCKCYLKYDVLKNHIEDKLHKSKVLQQLRMKNSFFYLVELQVEVYGINGIEEKQKLLKKETNGDVKKYSKRSESESNSPSLDPKSVKTIHDIVASVENPQSDDILDLIPIRFARSHRTYLSHTNDGQIQCSICKVYLPKDLKLILQHIKSSTHGNNSKIPIKKYIFFCEICDLKFMDEISWEKHFQQAQFKHNSVAPSRKEKINEFECTVCCTIIYGDELSLTRHLSTNGRRERDKQKKEIKLPETVKKLFKSNESIDEEGMNLKIEANAVLDYQGSSLIRQCCQEFEMALSELYANCKVYPFGSRISGLGNKQSDLDVFIDIGDMYNGYKFQDAQSQVSIVTDSTKIFRKHKDKFIHVRPIPTARTPIIKIFNISTKMDCDLSFRHGLSVENTKFLRFCLEIQPITHPFILLLKKWSHLCGLNEHITTYALAIMAIFYLQKNEYLMSIKYLRYLNPGQSSIIDGWPTINYSLSIQDYMPFINPCEVDLKTLLYDFFKYYANFKFETEVICPLLGYTISKTLFIDNEKGDRLPIEMKPYIEKLKTEESPELFRATSEMCIQDPFDLSHNLTKACSHSFMLSFRTLCDLTAKHLEVII